MTTDLIDQPSVTISIAPPAPLRYRIATLHDEIHIVTLLSRMLRELEPLGHDVLPTEQNIDTLWEHIFAPALDAERHGIYLVFTGDTCIAASFFAPERSVLDTPPNRAIAHGIYVDPAWRGYGIARELQTHAHDRLRHLGFESLISYVVAANHAGLASARAGGAHITGWQTTVHLVKGGV